MKAPVDTTTRPRPVDAVLPGLDAIGHGSGGHGSFGHGSFGHGSFATPTPRDTDVTDVVPAADVAGRLAATRVSDLEVGVSALEQVRRLESWVIATKLRLIRETEKAARTEQERWVDAHPEPAFDDGSGPRRGWCRAERLAVGQRSAVAEIACSLHITEAAAFGLLVQARRLAEHLPSTAAALAAGTITASAARLIAHESGEYIDAMAGSVGEGEGEGEGEHERLQWALASTEADLLGVAELGRTPAQLGARARRCRERCHPQTFAEREQAARADRFVQISPDRDGMARMTALLPAAVAFRIDGRLSSLARSLQSIDEAGASGSVGGAAGGSAFGIECPADGPGAGDGAGDAPRRTITQLRADILADLLTGPLVEGTADGGTVDDGASPGGATPARLADGASPAGVTSAGPSPASPGSRGAILAGSGRGAVVRSSTGGRRPHPATGSTGCEPGPQVLLTVSAETLLGGDGQGYLGVFGPIAARDARDLARNAASFMLGVTAGSGSDDGARVIPVVAVDGAQYRIPAAVRRALVVRDGTCRFPGCGRSAARGDIDHVTAWVDGGSSEPGNLAHLCRKHHVLKHHSGWSVAADPSSSSPPGAAVARARLVWTSPAGRRYPTEPDDPPPF